MSRFTLHHGDSREVLKTLAEASVDSIVCDPPYHLTNRGGGPHGKGIGTPYARAQAGASSAGFMGMTWDGGDVAHDASFWAECLRVAKPGAYLAAFGGSRTFHRLACAIEDAGWELRDTALRGHTPQPEDCPWLLAWGYASGFPKSHNLDNLRGDLICGCDSTPQHEVRAVRHGDVSTPTHAEKRQGTLLQPSVPEQGAPTAGRSQFSSPEVWRGESCLEGRGDSLQEEGELQGHSLPARTGVDEADGTQGRLHHGAPDGDGRVVRFSTDPDGSGASHRPRPDAEPPDESGTVAGQPEPQAGGAWPVCAGCGKPMVPKGLGTALKPAWEPIVIARKPLAGTVAANVLQHGTGALNIDGCRVHTDDDLNGGAYSAERQESASPWAATGSLHKSTGKAYEQPPGRWPANLIHDGSPEVLACFPSEAGASAPVVRGTESSRASVGRITGERDRVPGAFHADTGSAARFFYCAKASREDRNEGLTGFAKAQQDPSRAPGAPGGDNPRNRGVHQRENFHPTVKPTDLMRWLIRLVTPADGLVLDPFMGSGSTGKAAMLEGMRFVGIDLTADYVQIARARIDFALRQGHQPSLMEA